MAVSSELADRIRAALADQQSVREVKMFGGLSFMVNDSMAMGIMSDDDLLVRADPERADELLAVKGAHPAEMGAGRTMGKSWIAVDDKAIASDDDLDFWIGVALEYNTGGAGTRKPSA